MVGRGSAKVSPQSKGESSLARNPAFFDGCSWRSILNVVDLVDLRESFCIPESVEMTILKAGCVDREGYAGDVALTVCALTNGLRLPLIR